MEKLQKDQLAFFDTHGYARLGRVLNPSEVALLQRRIDAIMLGTAQINYDRLLMQLDSETGTYDNAPEQSKGSKGPTLKYRKIQDLEYDPVFLEYMQRPIFKQACAAIYGEHTSISVFRAMFMNKPAHKGTFLPWHQDRWSSLDRDPLLTVWTALDPATKENGCVQVIPGSHKRGIINPSHSSAFLSEQQAQEYCAGEDIVYLELQAGEACLLHNWLLHSSDVNRSGQSRRAFSVCYMDAATKNTVMAEPYSVVFGTGALTPEDVAGYATS